MGLPGCQKLETRTFPVLLDCDVDSCECMIAVIMAIKGQPRVHVVYVAGDLYIRV